MLEKKIPPLVLAVLAAGFMWALSLVLPVVRVPYLLDSATALVLLILGLAFCVAGVIEFRRAHTTVDPRAPEKASSLVTSGMYRLTRNPMYVGFALVLAAWAAYLRSLWSLIVVVGFVVYLSRFQILPEERALIELFGEDFKDYQARVRRWL